MFYSFVIIKPDEKINPILYLVTMHIVVKYVSSTLFVSPCRPTRQWPNPGLAHSDTPSPGAQATSDSP